MLFQRSLIVLVVAASILNATLGSKIPSDGYVYRYNEDNAYQGTERQNLPIQNHLSVASDFINALRRTLLPKRPSQRQGIAAISSTIQAAAVPLTLAAVAAVNRDAILDAINPTTTTASTTTATVNQCAATTCVSPLTCDTGSGLCKCGTGGPQACPIGGAGNANICIEGTGCVCGTTTLGACDTGGIQPLCLKADGSDTAGTETVVGTSSGNVHCHCSGSGTVANGGTSCTDSTHICCNAANAPTYGTSTAAKFGVCTATASPASGTCT